MRPIIPHQQPPIVHEATKRSRALVAKAVVKLKRDLSEAGRMLLEAKAACPHGEWLGVLKKEGISDRTARWLMARARQIGNLADLDELADDPNQIPDKTSGEPPNGTDVRAKPAPVLPPADSGDGCEVVSANTQEKVSEALPEEPLADCVGHPVPPTCRQAFVGLEKFRFIDSLCQQLQTAIDQASRHPGGEQLVALLSPTGMEGKTINRSEHLNALKRDLKGTRPYSVCPYCQGKAKPDCKGCGGRAWVTKTTWDGAEDGVKARLA